MVEENAHGNKSSEHKPQGKRRYGRIKRHFVVRLRIRPGQTQAESLTSWNIVTVRDLSAGGILFNYDKEIEIGTLIDLKINFPLLITPIDCVAKVVRIEKPSLRAIVHIAAVFVDIGKKEKELVEKAAEEFYLRKPQTD